MIFFDLEAIGKGTPNVEVNTLKRFSGLSKYRAMIYFLLIFIIYTYIYIYIHLSSFFIYLYQRLRENHTAIYTPPQHLITPMFSGTVKCVKL